MLLCMLCGQRLLLQAPHDCTAGVCALSARSPWPRIVFPWRLVDIAAAGRVCYGPPQVTATQPPAPWRAADARRCLCCPSKGLSTAFAHDCVLFGAAAHWLHLQFRSGTHLTCHAGRLGWCQAGCPTAQCNLWHWPFVYAAGCAFGCHRHRGAGCCRQHCSWGPVKVAKLSKSPCLWLERSRL